MRRQGVRTITLLVFWLLTGGIAAFQVYYFSVFTVDDAYISYQYAENFAEGKGLVFNEGEYVEGYTNFLWVVLLGVLKKLGVRTRLSSLLLGGAASFITLWLTYRLSLTVSREYSRPFRQTNIFPVVMNMAAVLYVAASPAFGIWTVAGLETPLFACLLTAAIWRHIREETEPLFPFSALLFGAAALVRPEGVLYFGISTLCAFVFRAQTNHQRPSALWKNCVLFLPLVGGHILWRWWYYGSLLPNTFYMKAGDGFQLSGFKYVYEFFLTYEGVAAFLICLLMLLTSRFREYWLRYILLIFGISLCYFIYVGGDWMPEFRFFVPILPLFFLYIQEGFRVIFRRLFQKQSWLGSLSVGILVLSVLFNNLYLLYKTPRIETRFDGHVEIGKFLQAHARPTDVLAAIDIGAMAYFSGLRTIDYFGLADAHIARMAPQEYTFTPGFWGRQTLKIKADTAYVLAQQPTFIELNTRNVPNGIEDTVPADPFSALMLRDPKFRESYTPYYHAGGTTIFIQTTLANERL